MWAWIQRQTPEYKAALRAACAARNRERYHNDPQYRERCKASSTASKRKKRAEALAAETTATVPDARAGDFLST